MSKAVGDRLLDPLRASRHRSRAPQALSWLIAGRRLERCRGRPHGRRCARSRAVVVAEVLEREGHGLVDDLEVAAAGQLLELYQREVGLDAGGVAIHHQADRAGRRDHRDLGVAEAVLFAKLPAPGPRRFRGRDDEGASGQLAISSATGAMDSAFVAGALPCAARRWLRMTCSIAVAIGGEAREGAHQTRHLRRSGIGGAGHHRGRSRQRWRDRSALVVAEAATPSAGRRDWRSPGPGCGSGRRARRSGATGTAPSSPRSRARLVHRRLACSRAATSIEPSSRRNRIRFSEARLHAVSSRNMYSEHGLEALMRPDSGQVCQSLIVVSYCTPGSAECQAASAMLVPQRLARSPSSAVIAGRARRSAPIAGPPRPRAGTSSVTRTELLAFCPDTEA